MCCALISGLATPTGQLQHGPSFESPGIPESSDATDNDDNIIVISVHKQPVCSDADNKAEDNAQMEKSPIAPAIPTTPATEHHDQQTSQNLSSESQISSLEKQAPETSQPEPLQPAPSQQQQQQQQHDSLTLDAGKDNCEEPEAKESLEKGTFKECRGVTVCVHFAFSCHCISLHHGSKSLSVSPFIVVAVSFA